MVPFQIHNGDKNDNIMNKEDNNDNDLKNLSRMRCGGGLQLLNYLVSIALSYFTLFANITLDS